MSLIITSCGSGDGSSADSGNAVDDPLIAESREAREHLRDSIERAQQYLPDKDESEQNSEISILSAVDEFDEGDSSSADYDNDGSYSNDEAVVDSSTDSDDNVPSNYNAAENSVITSNSNEATGFGTPDTVSATVSTLSEESDHDLQNAKNSDIPSEASLSVENITSSTNNGGGNPNIGNYESTPTDKGSYVVNKTNGKIHINTCRTLPAEENRVYYASMEEVRAAGYSDLCRICQGN